MKHLYSLIFALGIFCAGMPQLAAEISSQPNNVVPNGDFSKWTDKVTPPPADIYRTPKLPDGTPSYCWAHALSNDFKDPSVTTVGVTIAKDLAVTHRGASSLRIENTESTNSGEIVFQPFIIDPNKTYAISVWIKAENISGNGITVNTGHGSAKNFWGTAQQDAHYPATRTGTFDWQKLEFTITSKEDTGLLLIGLSLEGTGKAWFSHVEAYPVNPSTSQSIPTGSVDGKPSILFCSWNLTEYVDLTYYKELQDAGLHVDYLRNWGEFTAEKIKGYNSIVLFNFPVKGKQEIDPGGGPNPGLNYDQTLSVVKDYLQKGGGVIFNVDAIMPWYAGMDPNANMMESVQSALKEFGAQVPYESFKAPEEQTARNERLGGHPYIYWNDPQPSPVSEGVRGVWVPNITDGHGFLYSGPIMIDSNWTPVLRAGAEIITVPTVPQGEVASIPPGSALPGFVQRAHGEKNSVVFAIREFGAGRMALFHMKPTFHIGQGTKYFYNRIVLDGSLKDKPSDFGRLLQNTFRWISEPSLKSGQLGGAKITAERMLPQSSWPGVQASMLKPFPVEKNPLAPIRSQRKLYRGFIGAQTAIGGGQGTVENYAKAAMETGLDFVIFLEDWQKIDDAKMAHLKDDCQRLSTEKLLLIPGYRMDTNIGPKMFVYGDNPILPKAKTLFSVNKPGAFALQLEDGKGGYIEGNNSLSFIFEQGVNDAKIPGNVGFYDFSSDGLFRPQQCRAFGAAALFYYHDGKLVENVSKDYLETNAGCMTFVPLVISEVSSPEQMKAHVQAGNYLTYAEGEKLRTLLPDALRWSNTLESMRVFVSNGPLLTDWSETFQVWTYGNEDFVGERSLMAPQMRVHSDVGIKAISVYDGTQLFRRFYPNGAKDYSTRLYLSSALQQNLGVEVEDTNGGFCTAFPVRSFKHDITYVMYCSDHINAGDDPVKLARGPFWPVTYAPAFVPDPGRTWDGGPQAAMQILNFSESRVSLTTESASQRPLPVQTPFIEIADERVFHGGCKAVGTLLSAGGPWTGWGPLGPLEIADATAMLTLFRQPVIGVHPSRPDIGLFEGNTSTLFEENIVFKSDDTLKKFIFTYHSRAKHKAILVIGQKDKILSATPLDAPDFTASVPHDAWFGAFVPGGANSFVTFNRGEALNLSVSANNFITEIALPSNGRPVKKGDPLKVELFTVMWPISQGFKSPEDLLASVNYLRHPSTLQVAQGTRLTGEGGLQEFKADKGIIEVNMPKLSAPASVPGADLALRIQDLNPNWSAGEYQMEGYVGANYYSNGSQVFRPLGVDQHGRAYLPLYVVKSNTHTIAGHPVIADAKGSDLKIQVTTLSSPRNAQPGQWHLSVNNPTNHPITATLTRRINLPGMKFSSQKITVQPGEYRILEHGDRNPDDLAAISPPAPKAP